MLQYQPNIERMFHHVLLDAIPLLFLAPIDYRNALAIKLDALYYLYRSGGVNATVQITNSIDDITQTMAKAGDHWGSRTKDQIRSFHNSWQGFDERITALEQKVAAGKKQTIVTKKPVQVKSSNVATELEVIPEDLIKPFDKKVTLVKLVLQYVTEHPGATYKEIVNDDGGQSNRDSISGVLYSLKIHHKIRREGTSRHLFRYYPIDPE